VKERRGGLHQGTGPQQAKYGQYGWEGGVGWGGEHMFCTKRIFGAKSKETILHTEEKTRRLKSFEKDGVCGVLTTVTRDGWGGDRQGLGGSRTLENSRVQDRPSEVGW